MAFRPLRYKRARAGVAAHPFVGLDSDLEAGLAQLVQETLQDAALTARESILSGPKTGEVYGTHQASAPGEAPASETGELADSIEVRRTGRFAGEVVAAAEYAAVLEYGGVDLEARPFLAPAADQAAEALAAGALDLLESVFS